MPRIGNTVPDQAWLSFKGAGGGSNPTITPGSPAQREVVSPNQAVVTSITSLADTAVDCYINGVYNHTLTPGIMGAFTGVWNAPAAIAANVQMTFVGNITGVSAPLTLTVSVNTFNSNIQTSWGSSGWITKNANGAIVHPDGVGTVYEMKPIASGTNPLSISATASPINTVSNSSCEWWIGLNPASVMHVLFIVNSAGYGGYYDLLLDQSTSGYCNIQCVEKRTVNSINWYRIQYRNSDGTPAGIASGVNLYMTTALGTSNPTLTGTFAAQTMYVCDPRQIGDVALPFSIDMLISAHYGQTFAGTNPVDKWYIKWPYGSVAADMAGGAFPGGAMELYVAYPPGYSSTGAKWPVLLIPPPLYESQETGQSHPTCLQMMQDTALNLATLMGAVVLAPFMKVGLGQWFGDHDGSNTGNARYKTFLGLALKPWACRQFNVSTKRNDWMAASYSKGGNCVASLGLLFPTVVGSIGMADAATLNVFPNNIASTDYGVQASYDAEDPKLILAALKAPWQDQPRIVNWGGIAWAADYAAWLTQLTNEAVPHVSDFYSTWTYHGWGVGTNTAWCLPFFTALKATRAALV